jgi:hypothetical protein
LRIPIAEDRAPTGYSTAQAELRRIVAWYVETAYGRWEGPGTTPYYCDPLRVGHFAVQPEELARGQEATLLRLFVTMAMFQARRDVVIMAQQRGMPRASVELLTSASHLEERVRASPCEHLGSAESFDRHCSVRKSGTEVSCDALPQVSCHVKEASALLRRMGDMGKLPTSAWLHLWKNGRLPREFEAVLSANTNPTERASALVERFTEVYRVGRKLATMFVSALSTPALAPGLTPWFPAVDGTQLVVIDTNVAQVIDVLREPGAPRTYEARALWLSGHAARINLQNFRKDLPRYSPRLVQQALYVFRSKSNRAAHGDPCAVSGPCSDCVVQVCPFTRTVRQPVRS